MFTVNDRAIRGTLLQKVGFLGRCLDKNILNQSVFEPACSGFSDSSAMLRELTLKATLELVPSLNQPNLEKLSRYLVRLQSDPESSIRTNTVLVFSKIAPHMTETSRQKLLLPAFIRALKDAIVPCRLSAMKSLLQSKQFFSPPEMAARVLPAVTPLLLDPVKDVRREAFTVVDDLLFVLRQESERMPEPHPGQPGGASAAPCSTGAPVPHPANNRPLPPQQQQSPAPAPASGSYLGGLSTWMTSSSSPQVGAPSPAPPQQATAPQTPLQPNMSSYGQHQSMPAQSNSDIDDGWDEDEGMNLNKVGNTEGNSFSALDSGGTSNIDDDAFFKDFDSKPSKLSSSSISGSRKLAVPSQTKPIAKTTKLAVTKLAVDDMEDGWDDF